MQPPSIGRIVHFKGSPESPVYAAMITEVVTPTMVHLTLFTPNGCLFEHFVEQDAAAGWYWPPFVPPVKTDGDNLPAFEYKQIKHSIPFTGDTPEGMGTIITRDSLPAKLPVSCETMQNPYTGNPVHGYRMPERECEGDTPPPDDSRSGCEHTLSCDCHIAEDDE